MTSYHEHHLYQICMLNEGLRWRHNDHAGVSNHQPHGCLLNRLFRRKSKKTSKLRVTGLCAGNSPGTGEFPAQMASYTENVSIWWRHHGYSAEVFQAKQLILLADLGAWKNHLPPVWCAWHSGEGFSIDFLTYSCFTHYPSFAYDFPLK